MSIAELRSFVRDECHPTIQGTVFMTIANIPDVVFSVNRQNPKHTEPIDFYEFKFSASANAVTPIWGLTAITSPINAVTFGDAK
jgi:hypothetical protein